MAVGTLQLESLIVRLVGDASAYLTMLERAQAGTETFSQSVQRSLGKAQYAFNRLFYAISVPIAGLGLASTRAFATFDQAMTEATSIMGDASDEMIGKLRETAKALSGEIAQAPADLAKAFYHLASAGFDAGASMKALPVVAKFATAGAFDLQDATNLLSGAQSALNMTSKDAVTNMTNMSRVADVLVGANTLVTGSTKDFAQALSRDAGATMATFGISLEEGVAVLTAYHKANLRGAIGGNTYGRALRLLAQSSIRFGDVHEQIFGKSLVWDKATGKMRKMSDIVGDMEKKFKTVTPQMRGFLLEQMGFKTLQQKSILPLLGKSELIRESEVKLLQMAGKSAEVSDKQMQSFTNQMKMLWNQVMVLAIEIGESLAPAFIFVGKVTADVVKWFRELNPEIKQAVLVILGMVAAFTTLGVILIAASRIFLFMTGGVGLLVGGLGALILVASLAGAALVESFGGIGPLLEYVGKKGREAWDWAKPIRDTISGVVALARTIVLNFGEINAALVPVTFWFIQLGQSALAWVGQFISDNRQTIIILGVLSGAVLGLVVAFKALMIVLTYTGTLWVAGRISAIGYAAAMLLVRTSIAVYSAALVASNALMLVWVGTLNFLRLTLFTQATWLAIVSAATATWSVVVAVASAVGMAWAFVLQGLLVALTAFDALVATHVILIKMYGIVTHTAWILTRLWATGVMVATSVMAAFRSGMVLLQSAIAVVTAAIVAFNIATRFMNIIGKAVYALSLLQTAITWAYTAAVVALTAAYTALNINIQVGSILYSIYAGAMTIASAAGAGLTAVLAMLEAVIAPEQILAFVAALLVMAGIFAILGSAVYAVYQAAVKVYNVFAETSFFVGPLSVITGMLREWAGILMDVVFVASRSMPMAWALLKEGFRLAVSEIADLWPPLWKFVQTSAGPVWDLIALEFKFAFFDAISAIVSKSWDLYYNYVNIFGILHNLYKKIFTRDDKDYSAEEARAKTLSEQIKNKWAFQMGPAERVRLRKEIQDQIEAAGKGFKFLESDLTRSLRENVRGLRQMIAAMPEYKVATPEQKNEIENLFKMMEEMGEGVGTAMEKGIDKAGKKLDGVLYRSAEAVARMQEFQDVLQYGAPTRAKGTRVPGMMSPAGQLPMFEAADMNGPEANDRADKQAQILKQIRDILAKQAGKDPLNLNGADF